MRRGAASLLVPLLFFPTMTAAAAPTRQHGVSVRDTLSIPAGFSAGTWARQKELEARFLSRFSRAAAAIDAARIARRPHLAGTPEARRHADELAGLLRGMGWSVELERFDVWIPHPRRISVTLVDPGGVPRSLDVRQEGRSRMGAADSALLLGWNAYGASGTARGAVVYANFGLAADYDSLAARGIDVRDRIVLVRYGRAYRGVKVAEAERRGAAAVVLYSDPAQNGFAAGDTVPFGPMMPGGAIQLGTVSYLWRYTGDPLTPGRPSTTGIGRLDPRLSPVLPRLPVVPIPYAAAAEILARLGGEVAPEVFRGGLEVPYRTGPGPAALDVEVDLDDAQRPIWNVVARLRARDRDPAPGSPMVVLGSHHDAWLWGGVDAGTGNTALLQIARALAHLRSAGWAPRREIVIAFWDAEEMNVAGSTEWVEKHFDELHRRAVAYFNVDVFTAGTLEVTGSHQLLDLVVDAARAVADPIEGKPLAEAMLARRSYLGDLGAGSDWNAFWHWAGVPSLQWTMNGRGSWAAYHSALDDFAYYRDYADSAFVMTPAFARAMGLAALRLAEADGLPYRYTLYADRIGEHLDALEAAHPAIDLSRPRTELARFRDAAAAIEARQAAILAREPPAGDDREALARIDAALARAERALLDPEGLPGRPWYRHAIYAPGADSGYDALPLPALAEALRDRNQATLARATVRLSQALARATAALAY